MYSPLQSTFRTHSGVCADGDSQESHEAAGGSEATNPSTSSGVNGRSPLSYLPGFNIVWDFGVDMMHILEGWLKRNLMQVLSGKRRPTKKPKIAQAATRSERKEIMRQYKDEKERHDRWTVGKALLKELDRRSLSLGGEPSWIRTNLAIASKASALKAHDWLVLAQSACEYIFKDTLGTNEQVKTPTICFIRQDIPYLYLW